MKPTETTDLDENVARWLDWDKNEATRAELKALVDAGDRPALLRLFGARLAFGTAGIRGRMGPGPGRMNHLVIVQTTQGLVAHLLGEFPRQQDRQRGVVVGYDGRHNSRSFAEITASIILKAGVPVYLFSRLCPTPFVPFAIRQHNLLAGIMITASHNPKEDNGYKVYWQNGAQIIPPHDKGIQGQILGNLEPWPGSWDTSALGASDMLRDPLQAARDQYFRTLGGSVLDARLNSGTSLRFTYTAMHGVGHAYMAEAFRSCCFQPLVTVEEQKDPDPEFPTVKFPNPEEGKSALDLSMRTADASGSTVIIANDPDADRLAVAEKDVQTGAWRVFSGNELGALLGWWSLHCYTRTHPGAPLRDVYMLSSTVSSMILDTMARAEGFNFIETLTGFKWMGNVAADLLAAGKTVLFAFEEAIGFMWGTSVLDKDGISAGVKAAELAAFLDSRGQTLGGKLADIYDTTRGTSWAGSTR
ncbi:phosphopentomutase isoform X2 [Bacillus rossius redtenbacheri]|uniref:phosphopentomutase isoform X2 n=1 Tax=Bacillus rossius redtenbacheri TaxID=93214 RepID=UPI002FDE1165